jgi:short subunit dehydrogenase-like uncharacterized protein
VTVTIAVYGATGFTGSLVARALLAEGAAVILAGRDRARVEALAAELRAETSGAEIGTRVASLADPASIAAALAGAAVVIDCAGPFTRLGEPVVDAAIAGRVHYLDTAGEQAFLRDMYERKDALARRAGVAVVNGMAFEIALGDWAAALAADALGAGPAGDAEGEELDEVVVAYGLHRMRPTRGTRLSAIESLGGPGVVWHAGRWEPVRPAAERRTFNFGARGGVREAVSFPSGEVIAVPRHVAARRVQTFVSLSDSPWIGRAAQTLGIALPVLAKTPLVGWLRARADAAPAEPSPEDRKFTEFAVVAEARRGFARARVAVSGTDVYGLTALIAAWGAMALAHRTTGAAGVLAPAEVFDAESTLGELAARWPLALERSG